MLMVTYFLVSWVPTVLTLNGVDAQRAALAGVMVNVGAVVGRTGHVVPDPGAQSVSACGRVHGGGRTADSGLRFQCRRRTWPCRSFWCSASACC
jgi:hypothetical protein